MTHRFLPDVRRVHFVGIGGSGMSPLAEILHSQGFAVTGSDVGESDNVIRMRRLGIPVMLPQCTPPPSATIIPSWSPRVSVASR